jgi:Ca2+-binding RTX toxin-like protein
MTTNRTHSRAARRLAVAAGAAAVAAAAIATGPAAAGAPRTARVVDDTLIVKGSRDDDRIALRLAAGNPATLEVDFDDDGTPDRSFDRATFTKIKVVGYRGDDRIRIDQVNGAFADEAVTMYGGSGDDTLEGGDGNEKYFGGRGDDFVDGNRGADTAWQGSGDDIFRWDPGDGSDVVNGQQGYDTLDFNGADAAEVMSLSPDGRRSIFLRDLGNIRMDMSDVEKLDLTALGGTDTITIDDMSGTGFKLAKVDLSATAGGPDGAADVVNVNGTARADNVDLETERGYVVAEGLRPKTLIKGSELLDRIQVNTLDGNDDVDVDGTVFALIDIGVDLGPGQR